MVFEQIEDGWWMSGCVEIPEARTQGETLDEARENIKEAIQLVIEAKRELAERELLGDPTRVRESLDLSF